MEYFPKIFVSYLFSNSVPFEKIAGNVLLDELKKSFEKENCELILDKVNLMTGGKICEIIDNNPCTKFVIVIISENYLYTENCLYELYYLYTIKFPFYKILFIYFGEIKLIDKLNFIDFEHYFSETISYLKEKNSRASNIFLNQLFTERYNYFNGVQKFITNVSAFSKVIIIKNENDIGLNIKDLVHHVNAEFLKEKDFLYQISKPNYINLCPYYVSKNLIGRDFYLEELSKNLEKNKIVYLESGIPGIGKTTLAKAFINEEKYYRSFENIAWITVSNNILENFIDQFSKSNNIFDYKTDQDLSTNFKFLYKELQKIKGNNLLIIDNANNQDEISEFILKVSNLNWKILLIGQVTIENYFSINLPTINQEFAIELFYKHYKKEKNDRILFFVLNLINNHTLLIELIAKVANNNNNINILKLYEILKKAKLKPSFIVSIKEFKKNISEELIHSERELYKFIAEIFELENFSVEEISYLRYFTVLPPYEMSENLLINFFGIEEKAISEFNSTLNNLVKKGWLHNNHDMYSIHFLIQPVLFKILSPNTNNSIPIIDFFINNFEITNQNQLLQKKIYLPYAESIVLSMYDNSTKLIELADKLAMFYHKLENFQACLEYNLLSLRMKEVVFSSNLKLLSDSYNEISILYGILGNFEHDLNYAFKALDIRLKIYNSDDLKLAESYNNIAITLRNKSDYKKAIDYHVKDIVICELKLSPEDYNLANSYYETAITYYYLKNYKSAKNFIDKAVDIWKLNLNNNTVDLKNALEIQDIIKQKIKN